MKNILFLMEKLGFDNEKFKEGICFGCAMMASQAFVLGQQAYDRYQIRLNRIESLVDQYTKLPRLKHPANSSNVDRLNVEEARLKEIIKNFPPPINYLDEGENEWVSMRAFLESVAIAQEPQLFNEKYKIFPNRYITHVNPLHFKMIAELTESQLAEERGGFSQVGNFSGVYSAKEMKIVLNSWEQFMNEQEQSHSALIISNRKHSFMLGYDVDHKSWVMDDSSKVRKYNSSFLWDNKTNQLTKDIFLHVPLVQAGKISYSSDSEEKIIISTRVCSTNLSHSKMAQLFADEKWKLLHEVTSEKAKFQNKIGESWLNLAAQFGHAELVKELITAGSDVNLSAGVEDTSPLFFAAQNGHSDIVKVLIEAKADIDISPFTGCTPLYIAAQNGHDAIVKDLTNAGADINTVFTKDGTTPLFIAAQNGHDAIVKDLINAGADINTVFTKGGSTPLFIAAQNGHSDVVKVLIEAKADIDISSFTGCTPLYIAAQNGHDAIVKDLINADADINTVYTENGATPLFIAVENNHPQCVKNLLEAKADTNIVSNAGATPLFIAAQDGNSGIVKDLINAAADINISPFKGCTPLYIAAQNGHDAIVKDLINAGADINIVFTKNGATPLFIAAANNHPQCVKNLLKAGANPNKALAVVNATPLYIAAHNGHLEIVKELLQADAKINISAEGNTPLCIAKQNGHIEIVKKLEKAVANIDKLSQESTSETKKKILYQSQNQSQNAKKNLRNCLKLHQSHETKKNLMKIFLLH